jgi:hypothetical protein
MLLVDEIRGEVQSLLQQAAGDRAIWPKIALKLLAIQGIIAEERAELAREEAVMPHGL